MKDRVRVLHVIQNLNYGGMERLFADIVRRLDPARFESHVLVLGYFGRFAEGLDQFATLHQAVSMSRFSMLVPRSLARQIRGIAPDVVHTHSGVWYKTSLAARMAGRSRLIHTEHGRQRPDPWTERKIGWLASRRTDCVVAVSEILERQLRETVVAPGTAVRLIRNGVDTDQERPRPDSGSLRAELGLPGGTPVIGSIAMVMPMFWNMCVKMRVVIPTTSNKPSWSPAKKATKRHVNRSKAKAPRRNVPPTKPQCSPMAEKM